VTTKRRSAAASQFRRRRGQRFLVLAGALILVTILAGPLIPLTVTRAHAQPRMISYGYPNCLACHVSVQGRGLLNSYGRGIDIAQSCSKKDLTAILLGRMGNTEDATGNWDGRFGNVLVDFLLASRLNQRFDPAKTDPTFAALYRQVIFLGENDTLRINTEVGFLDSGLPDTSLGPNRTATGGNVAFLKKALLEWRFEQNGPSGKEIAVGRDYLPLGLQIDDATTFILHLNRDGVYDFPLQVKYFLWNENSLASIYAYVPTFQEPEDHREYGGGFLYERYPTSNLALGVQGLAGVGNESDRVRIGPYARWGITNKWALLAEADYSFFWDAGPPDHGGNQVTTYLQLFYHHYEWLVSSVTANYAYTDFSIARSDLSSIRYTTAARLNRNFTVGVTYAVGDILRDLGYAQELGIFATVKF
jgi:hypothetical protein